MTDRERLRQQLIAHEGLRLMVYTDSLGIPTIGVGRNLQGKGISRGEAIDLLDHDLDECIHDLTAFAWFPLLDAVRQRVVVDMRFNLGASGFRQFAQMLQAVAIGDYQQAATEMLASRWAMQTKDRADRLARMMRSGEDEL